MGSSPSGNVRLLTSPFLIWVCLWGNPKSPLFWTSIVEKVARRLDYWKDSYISKGGRITLLQFILNNISIYCLSIFIAPNSFCKTVEKLRRNFLWEGSDKHGSAHLVRWDIVTLPKEQRGLGIDKINLLNTALLCKWLWRYYTEKDSLWRTFIDLKYKPTRPGLIPSVCKHTSARAP